ncbi:MAG TPA: signal peptide peptidase SppA [Vicinamibacterales bacterium]|nr:signal peptide peptidase SppA [Vicinamibacterales bacterium]
MSELESQAYVPPPPPPRPKSRAGSFFVGALTGCLIVFVGFGMLLAMAAAFGNGSGEMSFSTQKVAIVPIEGELLDARETLDLLHRYANNNTVKAMVVRINSPGGAIAPSQEIYAAIRQIRKDSGKPIVASFDSVAASGGYYIAAGCDQIVANPGSITGSIGVVLQWFELKDLVQWAKMKPETIVSGALKDAGSPYRELTEAERQYFQRIVTQLHSQFVRAVVEGRKGKLSQADVARIADGRVFTGEEALGLKLVDKLGSIDDAVTAAAKMAGIRGEPARIWPKRREVTLLELIAGDGDATSALERIVSRRLPQFLYRW